MEIYLRKLELTNFRDITGSFELDPKSNEFRGQNGTGKTTLYDAETWLRTGKNSLGKADFDIKTIRGGKTLSKMDHSVKGTYMVNGSPLVLERIYSEKWTKTRGKSAAEKDGHKTVYRIDENANTLKKHFDQKVEEIFGGDEFLLCTDTNYFVGLHWQKRRNILSKMVDELDVEAVIDSIPGFRERLEGKTPEEKHAIVSERKRKINEDLKTLPARIDEHRRGITKITRWAMTIPEGQKAVDKDQEAVKTAKDKIANFESANASGKTEELISLNKQLREAISDFEAVKRDCQKEVDENNRQKTKIDGNLRDLAGVIVVHKEKIDELTKFFYEQRDSVYSHKTNFCKCCLEVFECPHCDEEKEEQERLFNLAKSDHIKNINDSGKELEDKIKDCKTLIKDLEIQKADLKKFVPDPCLKVDEDIPTVELRAKIAGHEAGVELYEEEMPESFTTELNEANEKLTQTQEDLAGLKATENSNERIKELEGQQTSFSSEFDQIEAFLHMYDQYIQEISSQTELSVSQLFGYVNFRMFNTQENGAVVPACDILNDEMKPYETAMSNGERIRGQLDILNTFQNHFKIYGPVFVDNCESVTNPQQLDSQMIKLVHDKTVKTLTQI